MSKDISKPKILKQGVFQFATGEDVPFGAEYLKSETVMSRYENPGGGVDTASSSIHFFLCYAKGTEEGKLVPVDAPRQEKPGSENSFLE